jgi:hypothetical protein
MYVLEFTKSHLPPIVLVQVSPKKRYSAEQQIQGNTLTFTELLIPQVSRLFFLSFAEKTSILLEDGVHEAHDQYRIVG